MLKLIQQNQPHLTWLAFLVVNLLGTSLFGQGLHLDWVKSYGGPRQDESRVLVDDSLNVYSVGFYMDSLLLEVDHKMEKFTGGYVNFVIMKFNSEGSLLWVRHFPNNNLQSIEDIAFDEKGNICVAGEFSGTLVLKDTLVSKGGLDAFLFKFDPSGNVIMNVSFGAGGGDYAHSIAIDSTGVINVIGIFIYTVDFDPGPGTSYEKSHPNGSAWYWLKLNKHGEFIDVRNLNLEKYNQGYKNYSDIECTPDGKVYLAGSYRGTVNFNLTPGKQYLKTAYGQQDAVLSMYDQNMELIWVHTYYASKSAGVTEVSTMASGQVVISGFFVDSFSIKPESKPDRVSHGDRNVFSIKLDSLGNQLWGFDYGGDDITDHWKSQVDSSGNLYHMGYFYGTTDFNPGLSKYELSATSRFDKYVVKFDPSGCFRWIKHFPSSQNTYAKSFIVDKHSNVYLSGSFYDSLSLDITDKAANFHAMGSSDAFILKLAKCKDSSSGEIDQMACTVFKSPSGNCIYTRSGVYYDRLENINGCDSILKINLTIHHDSIYEKYVSSCDEYFWPESGQTYTTSGTYKKNYIGAFGCDSTLVIHLTIHKSIKEEKSTQSCDSFYWGATAKTYFQSGTFDTLLQNSNGCDSMVQLNLVIFHSSQDTIQVRACNHYFWTALNQTLKNSGTYHATLKGQSGCDSSLTLLLKIDQNKSSIRVSGDSLFSTDTADSYQWFECVSDSFKLIGQESMYLPKKSGKYSLVTSKNDCSDTSECIDLQIVEQTCHNNMSVYPNPTEGSVQLDLGKMYQKAQIEIYSSLSQLMYYKTFQTSRKLLLDLPQNTGTGIYLLRVTTESGICPIVKILRYQ